MRIFQEQNQENEETRQKEQYRFMSIFNIFQQLEPQEKQQNTLQGCLNIITGKQGNAWANVERTKSVAWRSFIKM